MERFTSDALSIGAQIANILAIVPGVYCAYGTYVLLHGGVPQPTSTPAQSGSVIVTHSVSPNLLLWSFVIFLSCVSIAAIINLVLALKRPRPKQSDLSVSNDTLSKLGIIPNPTKSDGQDRLFPRTVLTIQDVSVDEPTDNPGIIYKDKIRVILTNHLDRDIEVWTPVWRSSEVQLQMPWCSKLQVEGPNGWKAKDWGEEHQCANLPIGRTFRCWIGLKPPVGASIKRRLQMRMPIGTAVFPVKINGQLYEVPIDMSKE